MRIKLLVSLVSALAVGGLFVVPAKAFPTFWTDSTKTTPLRDLKTPPKLTPDVLEFVSQGPVTFSTELPTGEVTVACNEVELGTTVVINNGTEETMLSVPSGVFENDHCVGSGSVQRLVPT